jgi:phage gp36-like protein
MNQPNTNINSPVTPSNPTVWYCDPGDIQRRLSTVNVKLHIEDLGKNSVAGEADVISDCIWDATEIINYYCQVLYRPEDLVKSAWVNRRATDIAVYILVSRRGNIQSASLAEAYKQTIAWLEAIHSSRYEVPGIPVRATQAPVWSNV